MKILIPLCRVPRRCEHVCSTQDRYIYSVGIATWCPPPQPRWCEPISRCFFGRVRPYSFYCVYHLPHNSLLSVFLAVLTTTMHVAIKALHDKQQLYAALRSTPAPEEVVTHSAQLHSNQKRDRQRESTYVVSGLFYFLVSEESQQ